MSKVLNSRRFACALCALGALFGAWTALAAFSGGYETVSEIAFDPAPAVDGYALNVAASDQAAWEIVAVTGSLVVVSAETLPTDTEGRTVELAFVVGVPQLYSPSVGWTALTGGAALADGTRVDYRLLVDRTKEPSCIRCELAGWDSGWVAFDAGDDLRATLLPSETDPARALILRRAAASAPTTYTDAWFTLSDDTASVKTYGTRHILVFTNTAQAVTVTLKQAMTLEEYLIVGGGGAGGNSISGGGGGGGVVYTNDPQSVAADTTFTVAIGAGGEPGTAGKYYAGKQGGHSTLTFGGKTISGYGGSGGAGFNEAVLAAANSGEVGSGGGGTNGKSIGTDGTQWNSTQGHKGWYEGWDSIGGGGGGAGSEPDLDFGGEGLPFDISGDRVVYGSGGGGGTRFISTLSIGGKGGTNAGRGGISLETRATAGVDGTGGGGGGGGHNNTNGTIYQGARGGSGTVILVFSEADPSVQHFSAQPIADQLYVGSPVEPSVVVTNGAGEVLSLGTDYTVSYSHNGTAGRGVAVVEGVVGSAYAGYTAVRSFKIHAVAYEDANIMASDAGVSNVTVGLRNVYIFTNTQDTVVFRTKRLLTRDRALLVGGGGSGGSIYGGGGGGGGYVDTNGYALVAAGSEGLLRVGEGAPAHPGMGNHGAHGLQGGHSWLDFIGASVFAYGGGGAASYGSFGAAPKAVVYNEIGSGGGGGGSDGNYYNASQGHACGTNPGGNARAGGGGALRSGSTVSSIGVFGGEGKTNDITGVAVVYGSGGGGCPPSSYPAGAGKGGTNAGEGQKSGATVLAGFGVDGTGSGGGGGASGSYGSGGRGGSGTVVLSFLVGDRINGRFVVAPIAEQLFYGSPVYPRLTVNNPAGQALVEGVDYVTAYENCDGPGIGRVTVSGQTGTIYEGYWVAMTYVIRLSKYRDGLIGVDDPSVRRIENGRRIVYVFTNAASSQVVHLLKPVHLKKALVVGGGGSGGTVVGGGGGGGGVVYTNRINLAFEEGDELMLKVGAGAVGVTAGRYPAGLQGGHSSLSAAGLSLVAYGGGGGAGFTTVASAATESGQIGSGGGGSNGQGVGSAGTQWRQGHKGGGSNTNFGGGGGGAGTAGGAYADPVAGHGGEGVTNSITGVAVVYGSGGGGAVRSEGTGGSSRIPGEGGTNAGAGSVNGAVHSGVDGTGAGGGGSAWDSTYTAYQGGNGGSGTVILEFAPIDGFILRVR